MTIVFVWMPTIMKTVVANTLKNGGTSIMFHEANSGYLNRFTYLWTHAELYDCNDNLNWLP